jgi:hypothetical protein
MDKDRILTSPPDTETRLWELEAAQWTSGRDSARALTAADAIMILPYPDGILQGDAIWTKGKANTGWQTVTLHDRSLLCSGDIAVLAYRVDAQKPGQPVYRAICSSTWLADGDAWLRLSHQQTPMA